MVSRVWRKVKSDWDAWNARSLANEPIVRLILDGTVVRVRLDRKATSISLLVVIGVRADGQKVLLAIKSMGGEAPKPGAPFSTISSSAACGGRSFSSSTAHRAWRKRSPPSGIAVPVQRCTVHKHRNLLAHAPERLHEEISADYTDMIYAATREEIDTRRKAFIRKWRLKHRAVADSLEEAGDRFFTFASCRRASGGAHAQRTQSNDCTRSSSAGSKRRPCSPQQRLPPCCSGRCSPPVRSTCARSMAGRRSPQRPSISQLTSPPDTITSCRWRLRHSNSNTNRDGTRQPRLSPASSTYD